MSEDYIPFEKALKDLKMSEEQLKRLVSQDEIQAMRDSDGSIQLRKEDIDALKGGDAADLAEELVFADEDLDEDAGMVTAVLEDDSLLEEEETLDLAPEELEVEESEVIPAAPSRRATPTPVRSKSRAAAIRNGNGDSDDEGMFAKSAMVATAVVLFLGVFLAIDITHGSKSGMTEWLANSFEVKVGK